MYILIFSCALFLVAVLLAIQCLMHSIYNSIYKLILPVLLYFYLKKKKKKKEQLHVSMPRSNQLIRHWHVHGYYISE